MKQDMPSLFCPQHCPVAPRRGETSEGWNKRARGNRLAGITNSVGTGRGTGEKENSTEVRVSPEFASS